MLCRHQRASWTGRLIRHAGAERQRDPDTLAEAGVPGYEAVAWLIMATRAGTPTDTVAI